MSPNDEKNSANSMDNTYMSHTGRSVDLFDGTSLLLTNDVECGQKACHQHHHNGKEGWNHEEFVVLLFIVEGKHGSCRER